MNTPDFNNFDWENYVSNYEDLKQAGINNKHAAYDHWINFGIREGRIINKIRNNLNSNNLFEYLLDDKNVKNSYFYVNEKIHNTLILLGITDDFKIIKYSNEWLYLISYYYSANPKIPQYNSIVETYNKMIQSINNSIIIDEQVVILITSFSTGTGHGYFGLFYLLNYYLENHNGIKVLVYSDSQKGILDIIQCVIPKDNIITITKKQVYNIKNAIYIENVCHIMYDECTINKYISSIIDKYIININKILPINNNNIAIIKNSISDNLTSQGIINYDLANSFSQNKNYELIEPSLLDEDVLINIINRCKKLILTFGTTSTKNLCYVSEKCEEIEIIIINGTDYVDQYCGSKESFIKKFKNANITYNIYDLNLNYICQA